MALRKSTLPLLIICASVSACTPRVEVLSRSTSPDERFDAVHVRPKTDATVGDVDWVYVVRHGAKTKGAPVFIADKVSPALKVEWSGGRLIIGAQTARVFTAQAETKIAGAAVPIEVKVADPAP